MVIWFLIGGGLIVLGLMWAAVARVRARQQEAAFWLGMAVRDGRVRRTVRKLEKMQTAHDPQLGRYYQQARQPTRKRRLRGR